MRGREREGKGDNDRGIRRSGERWEGEGVREERKGKKLDILTKLPPSLS